MPYVAVIRPGQTEFDEQDRIQGSLDLPLSDYGETQVSQIVDQIRDLDIEQIYASPTDPAGSTAKKVGQALGIPVKELEGLVNVDHGLWQGLCVADIKRKQPKVFRQWHDAPESICPPEGETCVEAFERARKSLKKLLKRRESFAIVSLEPMATLVECILRGEEPRMPTPGHQNGRPLVGLVELPPRRPAFAFDS